MSSGPRVSYRPLPDATPESGLDALADVYSFLIQRHASRKAAELGSDDQQKGGGKDNKPGTVGVAHPRPMVYRDKDAGKKRSPTRKEVKNE